MTSTVRCWSTIALIVVTLGLAATPAAASQDVAFSVRKGPTANANVWHAEASGHVRFFGPGRKVRVQGTEHLHSGPSDHGGGYVQVRQNLTNRPNDPAWQGVALGSCTMDPTPPGSTTNCTVSQLFQPANQRGHKLAGVWLRMCRSVKGPDPDTCASAQYRDNPLQG
jgi:hypothetical protein